MSDERVLREGIPVIGRVDIHEVDRTDPLPSERFADPIELALTFDDVLLKPAKSDLHPNFVDVSTRLTRITNAGLLESHPHDVIITKEAPNYQLSQR